MINMSTKGKTTMTNEAKEALEFLNTVTPVNIHLILDTNLSQRMDFESIWYKHGPQAARYSILARYMNKTIVTL